MTPPAGDAVTAPLRLGVLLSGGGRTLENLVERIGDGRLCAEVACVIADREGAYGLERARNHDLPRDVEKDAAKTFALLQEHGAELCLLCGYLRLLRIPDEWLGRVLNIHPALLPLYGGKGYYGDRVHRAVLEAGDEVSGCTVHFCDNEYDTGPILLQARVPVLDGDDVHTLADRVFAAECIAYPAAIELWRARRDRGAI
jgi:phosphoribosylglycinamide formyltransferase-1